MTDFTNLSRHCTGIFGQPGLNTPVYVMVGGIKHQPYLVAVNAAYFIAVAAPDANMFVEIPHKTVELVNDAITQAIPEYAITTTIEKLATWTGEPCWTGPCIECEGTGKVAGYCLRCNGDEEIECYCSNCDDSHMRPCPDCEPGKTPRGKTGEPVTCKECSGTGQSAKLSTTRSGQVADIIIDLNRLSRILGELKGDCKVWFAQSALQLRGEDWHAMLMPLREDKNESSLPVFQP